VNPDILTLWHKRLAVIADEHEARPGTLPSLRIMQGFEKAREEALKEAADIACPPSVGPCYESTCAGARILALLEPKKPREVAVPDGLWSEPTIKLAYPFHTNKPDAILKRTTRTDDQGRILYEEVL